ncbi:Mov34/MPN/PAD-1 family protein [Paenibacillus sepulcri]|uniref:Mov34/MPN/PAD-1 family protein n=1 Tax=Paenibacillus sepulcri TaxID=359917 RepID=UPI00360DF208
MLQPGFHLRYNGPNRTRRRIGVDNRDKQQSGNTLSIRFSLAQITREARIQLIESSLSAYPHEACGVLTGSIREPLQGTSDGIVRVNAVHPIRNAAGEPLSTFSFDPHEWVRTMYRIQKNRQSLVGFYHSHPASPPLPSDADLRGLQHGKAASYWIVSLAEQTCPVISAFGVNGISLYPLMLA